MLSGYFFNLKSLVFGNLEYRIGCKLRVIFLGLFKSFLMIEEVSFGYDLSCIVFLIDEVLNYV